MKKLKLNKTALWVAGGVALAGLATTAYFAFFAPLSKKKEDAEPTLGDYTKNTSSNTSTTTPVKETTTPATGSNPNPFSWLVVGAKGTTYAQPKIGKLTTRSNIRTSPKLMSGNIHQTWPAGTSFPVTSDVEGSAVRGNNKWYRVGVSAPFYYVHSSLVRF